MPILIVFILGVANFALHRATLDSDNPVARQVQAALERFAGRHGSLLLEFLILLSALSFAAMGWSIALPAYLVYTAMNAAAAWAMLNGRI